MAKSVDDDFLFPSPEVSSQEYAPQEEHLRDMEDEGFLDASKLHYQRRQVVVGCMEENWSWSGYREEERQGQVEEGRRQSLQGIIGQHHGNNEGDGQKRKNLKAKEMEERREVEERRTPTKKSRAEFEERKAAYDETIKSLEVRKSLCSWAQVILMRREYHTLNLCTFRCWPKGQCETSWEVRRHGWHERIHGWHG
ncbi:unnamed protein product [Triticum turgidum subsp. durum]|uniref:Uncharacterized protein n=1 Tax=Triticum turgidum subsp. durum TaxID=4567 RepID=A0A9R0Q9I4_TRITD|nr:unnamed protein product [Triticum turgidum subsp. durum]